MVRNTKHPHPPNGRSPLTVVIAASLLAGSIGSYSLMAPGELNLLNAQGGRPGVVTASTPGQTAALLAYQRPAQGRVVLLAGGNKPGPGPNRALPIQVLPSDSALNKPITFSLFAGWGGAVTWDPSSGEVTVAVGVGRQFSLSVNDLPSSGSGKKDDGSFFKGAGIQGEFGGKIPQAWASKVPGLQWAAGATITGKLNGKWSTDGSLTFRAIGQIKLPSALASKLPPEVQALFKNGSLSYGYQWKVDTHGSADARNWTIVSSQTGTLDGQSYSFSSRSASLTDGGANTLAAIGNQVFEFFKGGDFGGHVAGNVTVALGPRVRDAINSYMKLAFGDYSKQVNQDTKKLQDSNAQLQKDLKKDQSAQNQQQIKNLGNQIGTESGKLQKDISQYQQDTAQGVLDILRKYDNQPQGPTKQNPQAPGLPPGRQNDPASGTRLPFTLPPSQGTTGAPPNPGGGPRSSGNQGSQPGGPGTQPARNPRQPGGTAQSGGTGIKPGPVQGLPGTQSGPSPTRPQPGNQPQPGTPGLPGTQSGSGVTRPQPGQQGGLPGVQGLPGTQSGSAATSPRSSTQPPSGQRAGSGTGQPGGSGTPVRSSGQQAGAGGASGAVGGPGGQVPPLTPPPAGAPSLTPPPNQLPQPVANALHVQQPVPLGGSRPPARQPAATPPATIPPGAGQPGTTPPATTPPATTPPATTPPATTPPAGGQDQPGSGTAPTDTQGGGQTGQTSPQPPQTGAQPPQTNTQPPQTDTQTQPPSAPPTGQTQGLPGTQSGAAVTPPSQPPAAGGGGNPDVNPDGTLNTPPLDRTEPDGTPFQSPPDQPATPGQDPTKPPVIVPPLVSDNGSGTQTAGQTGDGTPVIPASVSAPAPAAPAPVAADTAPVTTTPVVTAPVVTAPIDTAPIDTAPIDTAPAVVAPPPPVIQPVPIPVADAPNPVVDSPSTVDTADASLGDTADPSVGDFGTPPGVGGDVTSGDTVVADLGGDGGGDA